MKMSGLIQFILGFIVGCVLLIGGTGTIAYFMLTRMATNPPKPVFSEEQPKKAVTPPEPKKNQPVAANSNNNQETKPTEEKPEEKPEEKEEEKLEPGAYQARVTWSTGLILRAEPNAEAERIGGVAYNQNIIILEESGDKQWQKIRFPGTQTTGWVKAGNIEKIENQ